MHFQQGGAFSWHCETLKTRMTVDSSSTHTCAAVLAGVHDGRLRLHQDQHRQGGGQRHAGGGPGHVPRHPRVPRGHGLQRRLQTSRGHQVS